MAGIGRPGPPTFGSTPRPDGGPTTPLSAGAGCKCFRRTSCCSAPSPIRYDAGLDSCMRVVGRFAVPTSRRRFPAVGWQRTAREIPGACRSRSHTSPQSCRRATVAVLVRADPVHSSSRCLLLVTHLGQSIGEGACILCSRHTVSTVDHIERHPLDAVLRGLGNIRLDVGKKFF